ncbi:hypothetical protein ACFQ6U_26940 [Streptomyces sp. NPDC056465]
MAATAEGPTPTDKKKRTPPFPGAVWCDACERWCSPAGICGCNNR